MRYFAKKKHIHIAFLTAHDYNYSISLLGIVVNLLLRLIYEVSFTVGAHV